MKGFPKYIATKQDFINYFKQEKENIAKIAQQKLQLLQQRMYQIGSSTSTSSKEMESLKNKDKRTFLQYVITQHHENLKYDVEKRKIETNFENMVDTKINNVIEEKIEVVEKAQFCHECGTKVSENSKFCAGCGIS